MSTPFRVSEIRDGGVGVGENIKGNPSLPASLSLSSLGSSALKVDPHTSTPQKPSDQLTHLNSDFHRNDQSLSDILRDHLTVLGPWTSLFGSEEVAGCWYVEVRRRNETVNVER